MNDSLGPASVLRLLRMLATLGAALVLVVIGSSAYLRLSQAGLSCADWPACYGNLSHAAEATSAQLVARIAHRIAASAVGFVLLALLSVSLTQRPRLAKQAVIALLALAVAVMLATVGAVMSESVRVAPLPAVTLANLLGGFALLALLVWLRETVRGEPIAQWRPTLARKGHTMRRAHALATVALLAVIVQVVLGAFVSAKFAALACPSFPMCGADAPLFALPATLDPFATLAVDAVRTIVRPPTLAALHSAHRTWAHVVLGLAAILGAVLAFDGRRRAAVLLVLLVILQLALGATAVLGGLPLGVVVAHNLVAAVLLATLVAIVCRTRSVSEVQPPVSEV